jgi:hypothetical protein
LALLISITAAYTEMAGRWVTPGRAIVPLLLIIILQLPALLNPFALDSSNEMDRYRIMPICLGRIIGGKHMASLLLIALSSLPLFLAVVLHQSWIGIARTFTLTGLVMVGGLLAPMLFMRTIAAQRIRMEFWKISGEGMSLDLFLLASIIAVSPVLLSELIQFQFRSTAIGVATSVGMVIGLSLLYARWLGRLSDLEDSRGRDADSLP